MIWISVLLSLLSLPLLWLVLPVLVMPPAAFVCGFIAFKRAVLQAPEPVGLFMGTLHALPMLLAVAVFALEAWMISTGYRA